MGKYNKKTYFQGWKNFKWSVKSVSRTSSPLEWEDTELRCASCFWLLASSLCLRLTDLWDFLISPAFASSTQRCARRDYQKRETGQSSWIRTSKHFLESYFYNLNKSSPRKYELWTTGYLFLFVVGTITCASVICWTLRSWSRHCSESLGSCWSERRKWSAFNSYY